MLSKPSIQLNCFIRASLVEQELLTFPQHLSLPPVFSWVCVIRSLVLCVCFVLLSFFLLAIVLSVLLQWLYILEKSLLHRICSTYMTPVVIVLFLFLSVFDYFDHDNCTLKYGVLLTW